MNSSYPNQVLLLTRFWEICSTLLLGTTLPLWLATVTPIQPSLAQAVREIPQEANTVYVNPQTGDDSKGEGSERSPWKTLSQALKIAPPQSLILLAPGTYSPQTGEKFPLLLQKGITIQGTPSDRGQNIIIQGSGTFISPTAGSQQVAIAAIRQGGKLEGVTITNTHPQGYGLWIESANPQVKANTFSRSGQTGIVVTGNSASKIAANYFAGNGKSGILVKGTATPQIENNQLERTGIGIKIGQHAAAIVLGNRFSHNQIGIKLADDARGKLRQNRIEFSSQGALVKGERAIADLGTGTESNSNLFRDNYGSNSENLSHNQSMVALSSQLRGDAETPVELGKVTTASPPNLVPIPVNSESSRLDKEKKVLPSVPSSNSTPPNPELPDSPEQKTLVIPDQPSQSRLPQTSSPAEVREISLNSQPQPTPPKPQTDLTHLNLPFVNPPPQSLPTLAVAVLPENNSSPPAKKTSPVRPGRKSLASLLVITPGFSGEFNSSRSKNSSLATVTNSQTPLQQRYRVMAVIEDAREEAILRSLYPDAFAIVHEGKSRLQIGVFSSQGNAETARQSLENAGLRGLIVP